MYLFVVFTDNSSATELAVAYARFTDDLLLQYTGAYNSYQHPNVGGRVAHFKVSESTLDLASKIVNDPTNYKVVKARLPSISNTEPPELILGTTVTEVSSSSGRGGPYARKFSSYTDTVRPAILRAGATSLFANV